MRQFISIGAALVASTGCITVDGMLPFFSNIHCSEVSEATCDPDAKGWDPTNDADWDSICSSCEDEYDWAAAHPWREKTLGDEYDDVRAIKPKYVTQAPFEIKGGETLDAYFIASHQEDLNGLHRTTIVLNHGRFASIEHYLPRIRYLHELGFNVFVWDYRGFGKSEPKSSPTLPQMMSDAIDAYDHGASLAPDPDKIVIYGMSLGGIPAGEMAAERSACAQIFEAAFNSVESKIETNLALSFPGSFLTSGVAENEIKLADTQTPTLILHGDQDDRIHVNEAQSLFDALPETLDKQMVIVPDAGHGIGYEGGVPEQSLADYRDHIVDFLEEHAAGCLSECPGGYALGEDGRCAEIGE